jgi:hypothetical protein
VKGGKRVPIEHSTETIHVPPSVTDIGESAPEINVNFREGAFWIYQTHGVPGGGMRSSIVGMSREQARGVRDAISKLLEPVI